MQQSDGVREGILRFYERFSAGDGDGFAEVIASGAGVSVTGTAPGEGHGDREAWIETYRTQIGTLGLRLQGVDPQGFAQGSVGYGVDTPSFVLPDGNTLPTRLTAVLEQQDGQWKVVHMHFSVGVSDEEAIQPAA